MAEDQHRLGHRARLRERFLVGNVEAVADYELLELVLFAAFPRGDIKPLAKTLLKAFKTFSGVITASEIELLRYKGMGKAGVAALKVVEASAQKLLREKAQIGPLQSTFPQVIDYCKVAMGSLKNEQLRLLFLDKRHQIITDEVQQTGTVDHTPVYTREVIKRALELGASGLIIVHNHPSGDPTPSQADIKATRDIQSAAEKLNIQVHDHIIIAKDTHVSFRAKGLM
ncbi:MAG: DNA repair protein RadC [Alphaproteobacteria bacterium]|nr:DNA repair protein RadC [Alphaproteobacteria bacterium]NCQ66705.1 DNA repair protein RadC [Alphaproteobacteria bacterium]NCT07155.1 DNA repair protein RadC [Alphaproteobacteria bacterium]